MSQGATDSPKPGAVEPVNGRALILQRRAHRRCTYPQIDGTLTSISEYFIGGKVAFMELAEQAAKLDPQIQTFVEVWQQCSGKHRKELNLDAICAAKGLDPFRIFGSMAEAAMRSGYHLGAILAALSHPAVVEKSIQVALTTDGVKDREMQLRHANFLPMPRDSQITMVNQLAAKAEVNLEEEPSLPSFEEEMAEIDEDDEEASTG